ncbi:hypothetical protein H7Q97_20385 [Ochrobactrum sp. CM-21-5]|nr:hypothetical protein [Ochrobactrum sp. CM-21-5]MBC2887738.1 hypothetical protein [Ochrobactrum sp. CM-21-5]
MNSENIAKAKNVSVDALTKGLSITLTRPECTDSGHWHHELTTTGSKPI